jgi:hypothetical protein
VAKAPFRRVLFLGGGSHFAGAREAALKMLEMTAGLDWIKKGLGQCQPFSIQIRKN